MKPVLRILLLVFYVSLCFIAWAQNNRNDTILTLDTVQITSGRIYDLSGGQTIITIDSLTMQQYACRSVADVVATQTMLNIKTYGPGMLSNISFRGNAPQHTGVFWNGISINASNIGMADFSLLPVNFFDKIEFQYGGTSSLLGSGSIGGSFHFWSQPEFTNLGKLQLNLQYGSFSDYSGALKMQWANKNLYSSTSVVYTDALNNFDYVNTAAFGSPVQKLSNAAFTGKGLMQDLSCKVNSRNTLSFAGWMQYSDRQIPGTMTTGLSEARQKDDILRLLAGWDRVTENNKIFVKAALTNENESYSDPLILLNSHINIKNYIFESGVSQKIRKNIKLSFNIHNTLSVADVKAYNAVRQQNRTAIVLSYYHNILPIGLKTQLHIRHEFVPHYKVPLFPSFGSEAKIWRFYTAS